MASPLELLHPKGVTTRRGYWKITLVLILLFFSLGGICDFFDAKAFLPILQGIMVVFLGAYLLISIRRIRDLGRSPYWVWAPLLLLLFCIMPFFTLPIFVLQFYYPLLWALLLIAPGQEQQE